MKRLIYVAAILLITSLAFAGSEYSRVLGDGEFNADGSLFVGSGSITAIEVYADGTNEATCEFWDNAAAASGTMLSRITIKAGEKFGGRNVRNLVFKNGIYLNISGTNAGCHVEIEGGP